MKLADKIQPATTAGVSSPQLAFFPGFQRICSLFCCTVTWHGIHNIYSRYCGEMGSAMPKHACCLLFLPPAASGRYYVEKKKLLVGLQQVYLVKASKGQFAQQVQDYFPRSPAAKAALITANNDNSPVDLKVRLSAAPASNSRSFALCLLYVLLCCF